MTNINDIIEGDLVKLTKGDRVYQGRVKALPSGRLFVPYSWTDSPDLRSRGPRLDAADLHGYTLEVIERAPRPAEPGIYTDREGDVYLRSATGKDYRLTDSVDEEEHTIEARPGRWITETVPNGPGAASSVFGPFTLLAKLSDLV
ncbi:hypothetical protein GMYAFLOJ_CDS0043 [Microbacterium phage phiMiGM15]